MGAAPQGDGPALEGRLTVRAGDFTVTSELRLEEGVLVFFGPSGAGKSLTLQALAGLVRPLEGQLRVRGEVLFDAARGVDVPAHLRGVGYVPQHHALLPFLDVAGNVAFGLPRPERRRDSPRVRALLGELGLAHLAHARPAQLSGGERQRVALARALAVQPRLLLLDEPFASLDQEARVALRRMLRETLRHHGTPAVFVTHDVDEALAVGDAVLRFARGRTLGTGAPREVLQRGGRLTLSGQVLAPPRLLEEGRAELVLAQARVRGPVHLLQPGEEGQLALELPAPDEEA